MKNLRLFAFSTCSLTLAAACLVAACGDDTAVSVDAGGVDGSTDAPVVTPDGEAPDAADGGGKDAAPDAPALIDAGLTVEWFKSTVASSLCSSLAKCCYGANGVPDSGAVDGGTFKTSACLDLYKQLGFEYSNYGGELAITGGNVVLDQAQALDCLNKVNALSCSLSGTELAAARTSCFDAMRGKLTAGQTCKGSIECAPGHYCKPGIADGGGTGTCTVLSGQGQPCSVWDTGNDDSDQQTNEQVCSWRAGGQPLLHCDSYDYVAGQYRARADWKCAAAVNVGQSCSATTWCNGGICDPADYTCKTPVQYFTPDTCTKYLATP